MPGLPICVYDAKFGMFRVTLYRGKVFQSGGFGVPVPVPSSQQEFDAITKETVATEHNNSSEFTNGVNLKPEETIISSSSSPRPITTPVSNYLFIEEVLFLHERGLLQALKKPDEKPMESPELFQMLHQLDVPLPIYRVYSHLRSQTFIVKRHYDRRFDTIDEYDGDQMSVVVVNGDESKAQRDDAKKKILRKRIFEAPPPHQIDWIDDRCPWTNKESTSRSPLAFDVYKPNSQFRKSDPGIPDFHVAVTSYNCPSPLFKTLQNLIEVCSGVPLKIATVSDGGAVVMFGLSDASVPEIGNERKEGCESQKRKRKIEEGLENGIDGSTLKNDKTENKVIC